MKQDENLYGKGRNVILYIGTSIDGYIADAGGTLERLESTEVEGDSGYHSLLNRIDTALMGNSLCCITKN